MSCLAPLTLVREVRSIWDDLTNVVPCGKCPGCLKRRQSGWQFRLEQEEKNSITAKFLTLTYSDEHLNFTNNGLLDLNKKDYQLFMKRLRKRVNFYIPDKTERPKIRYYACGEYGTTTHRPHMHAIMFDIPKFFLDNPEIIELEWQKGHIDIGDVTPSSIAYVTGYIMKQLHNHNRIDGDDRQKEFSLMSKKMGLSYLSENVIAYYQRKKKPYLITQDGQKVAMPRYFKEKLFTKAERRKMALESLEYLETQNKFDNSFHELEWKKDQYRKQEKNHRIARTKF